MAFLVNNEAAQDVAQGGTGQEILLLQPQLLALFGGVVGVEHAADGARQRLGGSGAGVIAVVERGQVERVNGPPTRNTSCTAPVTILDWIPMIMEH